MPGGDGDKANDLKERVALFVDELKKGITQGSCDVAIKTLNLLIRIISQTKFSTEKDLIKHVVAEGMKIQAGDPSENIIGNIIFRVLKIIRDERRELSQGNEGIFSEVQISGCNPKHLYIKEEFLKEIMETLMIGYTKNVSSSTHNLKASIIEAISEFKTEIEGCVDNIAALAPSYINENDVILTIGRSRTVEAFLKHAASKKIKFQVIVSECAPFYTGHEMAKNLAQEKINTTLITECQIGIVIPRVNKVIIGTHSIMANGGLKAVTGTNILAVLAKEHNKPVIVCSSMYKLSPLFHSSPKHASFNKFANPSEILDYEDAELLSKVEVIAPIFDYVPPHLVYMILSNNGAQPVSYVYRLVKDFYHPDDVEQPTYL